MYAFCYKKGLHEKLTQPFALLSSSAINAGGRLLTQDALWGDVSQNMSRSLQPLIVRVASESSDGLIRMLPNGTPINAKYLLFLDAINDIGEALILNPRPTQLTQSGLLTSMWRHAPVLFVSSAYPDQRHRSSAFTILASGSGNLTTGAPMELSTRFGQMRLQPALDVAEERLWRLASGFFDSDLTFILRRYSSFYTREEDGSCRWTPPQEAALTPVDCSFGGASCRTGASDLIYWDACVCQNDADPSDKP